MLPSQLGVEGESQGNASRVASSASILGISHGSELKERNYLGLLDCSSVDSSTVSDSSDYNKNNLNLKATELKLSLSGSQSPERDPEVDLDEKPLFPLLPKKDGISVSSQKTVVSGSKRGFSDAMDGFSETKGSDYTEGNWMFRAPGSGPENKQCLGQGKFTGNAAIDFMLTSSHSGVQLPIVKDGTSKVLQERPRLMNGAGCNETKASKSHASVPAAKAQVVGWPPIRSFRKNTLAATSKNNEEVDGKPGPGALFVKVSMDGAPYLRKVDLRMYSTYQELSSALEKMFSCFTIGQCGSHGALGREMLSDSKLRDLLHGSEYVLAYEDKDSDWMLVGDVPWELFIDSCKRLKIMKSSNAIGLAPRAMEKSKNKD